MSKILLTLSLSQDTENSIYGDKDGHVHGDKGWQRQFWIATKTDLAWAFDTVEIEAHKLFDFADEGVTVEFNKEGDDE